MCKYCNFGVILWDKYMKLNIDIWFKDCVLKYFFILIDDIL